MITYQTKNNQNIILGPPILSAGSSASGSSQQFPAQRSLCTILDNYDPIMKHDNSLSMKLDECTIYVGAEQGLSTQKQRVVDRFTTQKQNTNDDALAATHYFLLVTDTFLKSKDHLLPLISRMADPHFKLRIFPVIMDDTIKDTIFGTGKEHHYVKYWDDQLVNYIPNSVEHQQVKVIADNIALFIRIMRDTLMPPLDELIRNDLSLVVESINKRPDLFTKRFYFIPKETSHFVGREVELNQLSRLFYRKNIVNLSGIAGIGKTALALQYAKQPHAYPDGVFWLDASNDQSLEESFKQLAVQLGKNVEEAKTELYEAKKKFLLIFDNVTYPGSIPYFYSHTLIISSNSPNPDLILGNLSKDATELYLKTQLVDPLQDLALLGELLNYHPTKLTKAVNYIKSAKITVQYYINCLKKDATSLFAKQITLEQTNELQTSLSLMFPSILDPSPQIIEKYRQQSVVDLSCQLKNQGVQIFVSYNWSASQGTVDQIDGMFKNMDIQLLRDARELRSFDSIREFMKKVIREADYTFSFISDKYLKSFNCLFEIITILKDPNWQLRVFPILMPGTNLDDASILSYQNHWQLESERLEKGGGSSAEIAIVQEGFKKIAGYLRFVKTVQQEPFSDPLSPKLHETMALMLARQEVLEKKGVYKQGVFHLPMGRNKDFTGRESEMKLLEDYLTKGQYKIITNTGMGGVGKSQLALEYAYRHAKEYDMIYWIRSMQAETIKSDLRMLGLEMGITEDFLKDTNVIMTMKGVLEKQKNWLLIFDNSEDPKSLTEILPQQGGHILITSRNPNWENAVNLNVFRKDEALSYLQKISAVSGEEEDLRQLAEELGYLPLALTQAGAYIRRQRIDVAAYLTNFKEGQKKVLTNQERGYPGSVATAWLMSLDKISKEDPNAKTLLHMCSYLAPDNIPEAILANWLKHENKRFTDLDFCDALRILENYSLIEQKVDYKDGVYKKWINIHRLIQTVTREQCEKDKAESMIQHGIFVFQKEFHGTSSTKEEREISVSLVEHAKTLFSHAEDHKKMTLHTRTVADNIGGFYYFNGNFKVAKEYYEKVLNFTNEFLSTGTHARYQYVDLASIYMKLADAIMELGDLKTPEKYFLKALKSDLFYESDDKKRIAENYNNLGRVYYAQGNLSTAGEMHFKAFLILTPFKDTIDIAYTCFKLGNIFKIQGNLQNAKETLEGALETFTSKLPSENHTMKAECYNDLSAVLLELGDLQNSKEMCENARRIFTICYGTENHVNVASCYINLANVTKAQGDLPSAKKMCEKALEISTICYGIENHVSHAYCYKCLADLLNVQGETQNAKETCEKALKIFTTYHGTENHINVAESYNTLGNLYKAQGDLHNAKEKYTKALKITVFCLQSEDHPCVAQGYNNLGEIFQAAGDLEGAEEMRKKVSEINEHIARQMTDEEDESGDQEDIEQNRQKVLEEISDMSLRVNKKSADSYYKAGRLLSEQRDFQEARKMYDIALKIQISSLGENHLDVAQTYNDLGNVLCDLHELTEAKEVYNKALKIYASCLGTENHIKVARVYNNLGTLFQEQGNLQEAKEIHEKALKIKISIFGTETNDSVALSYLNLGDILFELKEPEQAKRHYIKAKEIWQQISVNTYLEVVEKKLKMCDKL